MAKPDKRDIKSILSARDRSILDATTTSNWVPESPAETILPYISDDVQKPEINSVEDRRNKALEIIKGYKEIEDKCEELKTEIEDRCKTVYIDLNAQEHLSVINAVKRVFGTDGKKITFQMYKKCIEQLAKRTEGGVPKPTKTGE